MAITEELIRNRQRKLSKSKDNILCNILVEKRMLDYNVIRDARNVYMNILDEEKFLEELLISIMN